MVRQPHDFSSQLINLFPKPQVTRPFQGYNPNIAKPDRPNKLSYDLGVQGRNNFDSVCQTFMNMITCYIIDFQQELSQVLIV